MKSHTMHFTLAGKEISVTTPLRCCPVVKGTAKNIVFTMHGYGDNASNFASLTEEIPVDDILWINMQAPQNVPFGFDGGQWYNLQGDPHPGIEEASAAVPSVIEAVCKATSIDPEKCFILGFSQGAFMTLQVGLKYTQKLAGLAVLSGYCGQAFQFAPLAANKKSMPIFIAHGTYDQVVFAHMYYQTLDALKYLECQSITAKLYPIEHTISQDEIFDLKNFIEANR